MWLVPGEGPSQRVGDGNGIFNKWPGKLLIIVPFLGLQFLCTREPLQPSTPVASLPSESRIIEIISAVVGCLFRNIYSSFFMPLWTLFHCNRSCVCRFEFASTVHMFDDPDTQNDCPSVWLLVCIKENITRFNYILFHQESEIRIPNKIRWYSLKPMLLKERILSGNTRLCLFCLSVLGKENSVELLVELTSGIHWCPELFRSLFPL